VEVGPPKGVVIIYGEGGLVNGENKDWKLFWPPYQTKGKRFVPPPHKGRNVSDPPPQCGLKN
jgi:hypothetical protein